MRKISFHYILILCSKKIIHGIFIDRPNRFIAHAPTERGVKHLLELAEASKKGYKCFIAFVIQIPGVKKVFPNIETHAEFAQALETARKCGVEVLVLKCQVLENSLKILNKGIL